MRIDPPVSLPSAPRHSPAATAAPEPLDEAPGTWSGFQGLRAAGKGPSTTEPVANSERASLPSSTAPASYRRVTHCASAAGTWCSRTRELAVVRMPAVS